MKTNERMEEIKALITILIELKMNNTPHNEKAALALEPVIDIIWDGLTDSQQGEIATFEWNLEQEDGLNQPKNAAELREEAKQHNLNFEIDQHLDSLENDSPLVWP